MVLVVHGKDMNRNRNEQMVKLIVANDNTTAISIKQTL